MRKEAVPVGVNTDGSFVLLILSLRVRLNEELEVLILIITIAM